MAFKKPAAAVTVPESPDRLFRDLPKRRHPSLFDHQGQMLRNYVATALEAKDVARSVRRRVAVADGVAPADKASSDAA